MVGETLLLAVCHWNSPPAPPAPPPLRTRLQYAVQFEHRHAPKLDRMQVIDAFTSNIKMVRTARTCMWVVCGWVVAGGWWVGLSRKGGAKAVLDRAEPTGTFTGRTFAVGTGESGGAAPSQLPGAASREGKGALVHHAPPCPPARPQPPHKVNLTAPAKTIVVSLLRNTAAVSVLERYFELRRYNLKTLTTPPEEEEEGTEGGGKQAKEGAKQAEQQQAEEVKEAGEAAPAEAAVEAVAEGVAAGVAAGSE